MEIRIIYVRLFICLALVFGAGVIPVHAASSIPVRAVMETFPAAVYPFRSHVDRIGEYADMGMNMYLYGPSDDRIRSADGWKFPYKEMDVERLRTLSDTCAAQGMEFVWTIDPGASYGWNDLDYKMLLNKLILMYYNGLRSFAVMLDGPRATSLMQRLMTDFVATRREPVSLYSADDFTWIMTDRPAVAGKPLAIGPVDFPASVPEAAACRMVKNDVLTRISVYCASVWMSDPAGYDRLEAWDSAVGAFLPETADAYRLLATYADDSDALASRRAETFTLDGFDRNGYDELMAVFERIASLPSDLSLCSERSLMKETEPWVENMGLLGRRGINVLECLGHYMDGDQVAFLKSYVNTTLDESSREKFAAHPVGTASLMPFCDAMSDELASVFYRKMAGGRIVTGNKTVSGKNAAPAIDGNLSSFARCTGRLVFDVPSKASVCHILLGTQEGRVIVRQIAKDGSLIAEKVVRQPYIEMEVKPGTVKVDILGNVEVFETIFVDMQ